ncbi:MAG TPA: hypothetical protein VHL08_03190 [Dongiaceae bacterium]|nr:hypothetical protein [Dongiaceae bacterium]
MADHIQLSAGIRSNLLLLQQTSGQLSRTQLRLATGNKVNSALDGPTQFFAAQSLNQRADDLSSLKDNIGQAISTIKAANTGISSISTLLQQAQGITTQALGNLGNDINAVKLRASLAQQYNDLLHQIDKIAQDSGYQGRNLLIGSGLRLDATDASRNAVDGITGLSSATVTNATSVDDYNVAVTGDGAISGNVSDIASAERDRGVSNLSISGFASRTNASLANIGITLQGGVGRDKTFTLTEGGESYTITLTQAQSKAAKSAGQDLVVEHKFSTGTNVSFNVNFDDIESVPDTAGVGQSTIQKSVNLQLSATSAGGSGVSVSRDAQNALGAGRLSDGQNAFAFETGTVRLNVDQKTLLQSSKFASAISNVYGTNSGAVTSVTFANPLTTAITQDGTFGVSAKALAADYDFSTNTFTTSSVILAGPSATVTATDVSASNASSVAFTAVADDGSDITLGLDLSNLRGVTVAAASTAADANTTEQVSGNAVVAASVAVSTVSGFANNTASKITIAVKADASNVTFTLTDSFGGTATLTKSAATTLTSLDFTIAGGANDGAAFNLTLASAAIAANTTGTLSYGVIGAFTGDRTAKFDERLGNAGKSATLSTAQVSDASDANNLSVQLNETNTSQVTVVSQNVQTDGQGLQLDLAQNNFSDRSDIQNAIDQLNTAISGLRGASSGLSTNLNIIQTRQDYTNSFTNVLTEGANSLIQADQNEEGANILTLQTRQQLGTISLSLANQAQQAILRLF